jgi:TetR/AcrR family transcriptional regulator, regulator of cefoperazone and chloramphenicol sensitivity
MRRPASKSSAAGRAPLTPAAEQTRIAILHAALKLFGENGFDGTSTRDIAAAAKANIGSIAYHFGGKEGLRTACAEYIVATVRGLATQATIFDAGALDEKAAHAQLETVLERMVTFIVASPQAGEIVQFILRELAHPTAALDIIYRGVFEPVHKRLCEVWAAATGEPAESERTRIAVFTMIGQVVYFRIGREAVRRRMGWNDIGPAEAAKVVAVAKDNLAAVLAARKKGKP